MMYYKANYNLLGSFKSQSPSDTSYPMLLDALDQVSISRKFFISLVTYSENSGICLGGFIFDADLFRGAFLSDVLHPGQNSIGGKKDLWLVVFNDVVLRHQRTGITSLPLVSSTNSSTNSLQELQVNAKYATTERKGVHTKPRNLYKFIKVKQKVYSCENKLTRCTE